MAAPQVISPALSPDYPQHVRKHWERFVSGALIEADTVRPLVQTSWVRCRDAGLDPFELPCPQPVSEEELAMLRERDLLFQHGAAAFDDLIDLSLLPPRSIVVVANQQAQALHITGAPQAVSSVTEANIVPGSLLEESAIGTNVVSLACHTGQPSITHCAEHYSQALQMWQSCAVPIVSPETDRLAGVITLCSLEPYDWQPAWRLLSRTAKLLSLLIENEAKRRRCCLLEHHQTQQLHAANDALVTVDSEGVIQAVSPAAAQLAQSGSLPSLLGLSLSAAGLEVPELTNCPSAPAQVKVRFRNRQQLHPATVTPVPDSKRPLPLGYVLRFSLPQSAQAAAWTSPTQTVAQTAAAKPEHTFDTLIGQAPVFLQAVDLARRAAACDDPVLITGESGTGKELIAQAIHRASPRAHGPFVAVNCSGMSEELIAAELFGYTAGAFTGALRTGKQGKIEQAHAGTLFLDEVGDMPLKMQQTLLRVLEEQTVTPLGANRPRPVAVRIIAATNANLADRVQEGTFRLDLFHRLQVLPIGLPPLRERAADIPLLVNYFLAHFLADCGRQLVIAPHTMDCLLSATWPGNIRELRNLITRWVRFAAHNVITPAELPAELREAEKTGTDLKRLHTELEKDTLLAALQQAGGKVSQAARTLGISRVTLYRKLKRHQIEL